MSVTIQKLLCLLFLLFVICPFSGMAQETNNKHNILLKSGTITATPNAAGWLDSMAATKNTEEPIMVFIHFNSLPDQSQQESLKQHGVSLLEYIPENTFIAHVQFPVDKEAILELPIHSFINSKPEWKSSEYVWGLVKNKIGGIEVLVSFYQGIEASKIKQFIAGIGGQIERSPLEKYASYKIIIDASKIQALAQWYGVSCISPVSDIVPLDIESVPAVKGNIATAAKIHGGYDLQGDSVTVGVGDDASGIYHADINDRITNFNPVPLSNHGEHVNGIVGGSGNIDPFAQGMAPHVALIDYLYDLVLPSTGAMYHDFNMTITNNSYEVVSGNCAYAGTYDGYSRFVDTLSIQYPYVLHVFASGNDGAGTCSPYPQGYATIGGGYQPAKNNVVVGSMMDHYTDVGDESRGPMRDGRLKPEIEATGLIVYSTVGIDDYEWAAGTSMATPHVAGGLAVLTQRYKQLNSGSQPRADLLKTILLNGAMDLGNPGPDFNHGFGEMDIYRSLLMIDSSRYTTNNISNGDSQSYTITVPTGTGQLKIMLYWADIPASVSSAKQLVNDMDLTVKEPTGTVHLPLVLDPSVANVNKNAVEGFDHTNNVEQVTINNPVAGIYTIKTKGYSIPYGPQHYVIAYDFVPASLHLTFPIGGEQLLSDISPFDTVRAFWDAGTITNTFKLELSQDNGTNWKTVSDTLPPTARHCSFLPDSISSCNMLVRLSRNGTSETATSGRFCVNAQAVLQASASQCPGYFNMHWSPVKNATSYYLLQKKGFYMQVVDSTTDTMYTFRNLPLNSASYVTVQPVINGLPAYRSVALKVVANSGDCSKPVSNGDLMADKIVAPVSGRMFTSSQLGTSTTMKIRVRNLYTAVCDSYKLSWQINGGPWQSLNGITPLPVNDTAIISVPGLNFSAIGSYTIKVAIHNLRISDPNLINDTTQVTILNIPNDTINLATPFNEGFETLPAFGVQHDSVGLSPNGHWDFFTATDSGRMRSFVNDNITISGNRSVSLDAYQRLFNGSKNSFTGTFNLSNYDTATTELRVDFDYLLHGNPKSATGNLVTARLNDTSPWDTLFTYNLTAYPGHVATVNSLSLTDLARHFGKNFSSSTQVSFGQSDTSLIAATDYGNGITIDNFNLYTVVNDAAMVGIVSPAPNNCGLPSPGPLTVRVHNGVNHTLHNINLYYSLDGGTTYSGMLDSIGPKATVNYTFSQQLSMAQGTTHNLNVWLSETGDSYLANDSIINYHFRNSQVVNSYPYLENFEAGDGGYYHDGYKDSWQYGTPASTNINKAASGTKAWKTNLSGNYSNLEVSYLYSPCFDLSGLTKPMLSFSMASDIENCGNTLCDAAYLEYSYDGINWTKLGASGQGTNWYDSTFNIWNTKGFTRWHVASILLPQPGPGYTTHFRFVLAADPGVTYEGIAVDDIHIFDLANPIYQSGSSALTLLSLNGSQWTDYLWNNTVLASVQPNNQQISNATLNLYNHDTLYNPDASQYTFPESYSFRPTQQPADTFGIRLYLLESDLVSVLHNTTCPSCSPITDAYRLGITQFSNPGSYQTENGTLADDTGGTYIYHRHQNVKWVPYDKGYYAEIRTQPFSEFWFNDGGPTGTFPAGVDYLNFMAWRNGTYGACYWNSWIDTSVAVYTVQWSLDSIHFATAIDTPAMHVSVGNYSFQDPVNFNNHPVLYYRLKWTMTTNGNTYYSPIRTVKGDDSATNFISFNATMVSHKSILNTWTSYLDGVVNHYILQRAIGNNGYSTIDSVHSQHHFGQQYNFTDQPNQFINTGTLIHYRLTAYMEDHTSLVLPEKTIEWINNNTFVNIFPNPTHNDRFTIQWFADAGTKMQLKLTDDMGRSIYSSTFTATQWNNTTTIQTENLAHGVYFVKMIIGGNNFVGKIVFE